ncbi:MAG: hypothetical protein JWQ43_3595, partial [Glaciihabitans sp.]|nr:hypothetical protein [Glaciihabitans sp.]
VAVSRADACEVSVSTVSKMNGKVYSEDALLISSSVLGGSGPTFRDLVQTKWSTSSTPAADGSRLFRTFAQLPASAPSLGSKLPQTAPSGPVLPTWNGTSAAAAATCTYTGPTRIRMVGANVVVTSPTTPNNATGPSYCYTSAASTVTVPQIGGRSSVYEATYPYAGKTIYVKNSTTASSVTYAPQDVTTVRNATNSLFLAEGATTVNSSVVSPGTPVAIGTWTPKWSGTTNTQNRFQSDIGKTLPAFQTATQTALAAANTASPLSDILSAAIGTAFNGRNNSEGALLSATGRSYNWALPSSTTAAAVRTTGTATYGASTGASSDPLYSGSATTSPYSDSTVETATTVINRQQMTCSVLNVLGLCVGTWIASPGVAAEQQIQVTATKTTTATGTITTRVSAFPLIADRTGYSTTTGDAYVEGSVSGGLSIAAENNVIVTGDVRQTSGSTPSVPATQVPFFTSTDAVVLAAQKNVLLYHPVSCKSVTALAATTASYCPNDVTGLYTGGMSSTTFDAAHPSRQYLNLLATPVKQVDAAIYALNGSLQLMNYNRGVELGTLKVNGGAFQEHHGVTGVEWETLTTNSAVRRQSGYNLEYLHDNSLVGKNFPWVPTSTAYVGLVWTLQGVSESVGSAAVAP